MPLGVWRQRTLKLTAPWFAAVHASIPLILLLRILLEVSFWAVPFSIGLAFLGQFIGARCLARRASPP